MAWNLVQESSCTPLPGLCSKMKMSHQSPWVWSLGNEIYQPVEWWDILPLHVGMGAGILGFGSGWQNGVRTKTHAGKKCPCASAEAMWLARGYFLLSDVL